MTETALTLYSQGGLTSEGDISSSSLVPMPRGITIAHVSSLLARFGAGSSTGTTTNFITDAACRPSARKVVKFLFPRHDGGVPMGSARVRVQGVSFGMDNRLHEQGTDP